MHRHQLPPLGDPCRTPAMRAMVFGAHTLPIRLDVAIASFVSCLRDVTMNARLAGRYVARGDSDRATYYRGIAYEYRMFAASYANTFATKEGE